jgi:hypothetical protein
MWAFATIFAQPLVYVNLQFIDAAISATTLLLERGPTLRGSQSVPGRMEAATVRSDSCRLPKPPGNWHQLATTRKRRGGAAGPATMARAQPHRWLTFARQTGPFFAATDSLTHASRRIRRRAPVTERLGYAFIGCAKTRALRFKCRIILVSLRPCLL